MTNEKKETNKRRLYVGFWSRQQGLTPIDDKFQLGLLLTPKEFGPEDKSSWAFHIKAHSGSGCLAWEYVPRNIRARTERLSGLMLLGKVSHDTSEDTINSILRRIQLPNEVKADWTFFHWTAKAVNLLVWEGYILKFDNTLSGEQVCATGLDFVNDMTKDYEYFLPDGIDIPTCDVKGKIIKSEVKARIA